MLLHHSASRGPWSPRRGRACKRVIGGLLFAIMAVGAFARPDQLEPVLDIGSRLELFVDDFLIDRITGLERQLQRPTSAGTVMRFDRSWEGVTTSEVTILHDGDRCACITAVTTSRATPPVPCCGLMRLWGPSTRESYAMPKARMESVGPVLRSESSSSRAPRITTSSGWTNALDKFRRSPYARSEGADSDMFVFKDSNPAAPASQLYKAFVGDSPPLVALVSPDGLHWTELQGDKSLIAEGLHENAFDNLTIAFWDPLRKEYVLFMRDADPEPGQGLPPPSGHRTYNYGHRSFKFVTSPDFVRWSFPQWVDFGPAPHEHLYANSVTPYFRAPHIYISFPMRLVPWRTRHRQAMTAGSPTRSS